MRKIFQFVLIMGLNGSIAFAGEAEIKAYRTQIRSWVMSHSKRALPTIAPQPNDQASDLVDDFKYANLFEMENANLLTASLTVSPWSGSYWPTYAGQLANRYADPEYRAALIWKNNVEYLEKILGKGKDEELSPAEKYDLLVGDRGFTLTKKMIRTGEPYADAEGVVPTWFGICHGWAAASFMMPRPERGVAAKAADGRDLYFSPSDLKALGTLLWANGAGETRYIGGRCNDKEPERDHRHRETNPDCFDTNPATWHLAVVNQIGVSRRSFILDASAGYEVWNQPVLGYKYGYINPITGKSGRLLTESKVKLSDWKQDPFSAHRSPKAEYIVKIIMSLNYLAETTPSTATADSSDLDAHYIQNYVYDLELDRNDNIVGGEWHTSVHPDFLWLPVKDSRASSVGDSWLEGRLDNAKWNGREPVPASWQAAAKLSSVREQPLARVVSRLFEMVKEVR